MDIPAGATTWVFPSSFAAGSSYSVTVQTQPIGELCEVTGGGSGVTLAGNVDNVTVACGGSGQWTWEGGLNTANGSGVYGTQGAAAASNVPGARYDSSSWTDSSGNFWMFGGYGYDATGVLGALERSVAIQSEHRAVDLGQWRQRGSMPAGSTARRAPPRPAIVPGARYSASSWIDSSGNLWLFGGYGYDSAGAVGQPERSVAIQPEHRAVDLGQWRQRRTMPAGSTARRAPPRPATCRARAMRPAPGSTPPATCGCSAGRLRLHRRCRQPERSVAIHARAADSGPGSVAATATMPVGVYGTQGTAAASNVPGARQAAIPGSTPPATCGCSAATATTPPAVVGYLNDLWQYSPSSGEWTWVSGGSADNASGVYGTAGHRRGQRPCRERARRPVPGSTRPATCGCSAGSATTPAGGVGYLNDLWQYSPDPRRSRRSHSRRNSHMFPDEWIQELAAWRAPGELPAAAVPCVP